jgi:two-component system sensor histidine kinase HydH
MPSRTPIQPRYIVAATALVTVLMLGTAFIELRQSREEIYHLMREEAVSLAETIDQGGANAILSMDRLEDLLASRLLDNAYYIARLDSLKRLRDADLAAFADANGLFRVNIFDRQGTKIMSSIRPDPEHADAPANHSPRDVLRPILEGATDRLVIGIKDARVEDGQRFAVAVRRTRSGGGAIVVNIDAADLLSFRRSIGIGKLIRDLGDNSGIVYVALQDAEGIIAASHSVRELTSVSGDEVLRHSMDSDTTLTRVVEFQGSEVYEVIHPFAPEGQLLGVLRIAMAMDEVRSAEARMSRRMLIMSLVVIVLGALAVTFLMVQQNYRVMERKYTSIKTFTGNILSQMRDGVVTVDPSGTITIFNPRAAELLGTNTLSVEGRPLEELQGTPAGLLTDIFAQPDGISELQIDREDGAQRIAAVSLSTTMDSGGALESRTAVLRDLTDARRLEREAQRKEKLTAMGELASGVAHEIRNPLNAIAMIAQRFAKEFVPRTGAREYRKLAKVMQDEARRVNGIIRQFLSFARPPELHRQRIAVSDLVGHVSSLFSGQAADKGITFTASPDRNATVSLDSEQMKQALLNLLQNALEATPAGGKIELTGTVLPEGTRFTVADTGPGIPAASLDKIFNLYYTTKPDGTGLGLSITQQIVAQHGGTIEVSSTEGKGTVFTILLPDLPGS